MRRSALGDETQANLFCKTCGGSEEDAERRADDGAADSPRGRNLGSFAAFEASQRALVAGLTILVGVRSRAPGR
jgi:hypothetical protein